jgi:hypothetical protein
MGRLLLGHNMWYKAIVLVNIATEEYGSMHQQQMVAIQLDDYRFSSQKQSTSKHSSRSVSSSSVSTSLSITAKRAKRESSSYLITGCVSDDSSQFNNSHLDMIKWHLPLADQRVHGGKCCDLCKWDTGKKVSSLFLGCYDCDMSFCALYYKTFHTSPLSMI